MKPARCISVLFIILVMVILFGCSQSSVPLIPDNGLESLGNDALVVDGSFTTHDSIGVMGGYSLDIDAKTQSVELTPLRMGSIGESYIVSGIGFFTIAPCVDCLKLSGFKVDAKKIALSFKIKHPFNPGIPSEPPTAVNRLDLDVFDLALVVVPTMSYTPINFPLTGVDVYSDVVVNATGYTRELSNLIGKQDAMPYVLVVDNSTSPPPHNWNKFGMGAESFFDVIFKMMPGLPLKFDMYLTMGYGASAKKPQRLTPKYYNPEFNRKAAWKVTVIPPGPLLDFSPIPSTIKIKVYDWQIGATEYGDPADFANAPTNNVYAASEVESVSVEIPGMAPTPFTTSTPTGGAGLPDDPLIYEIPLVNVNMLSAGFYSGVVKVTDTRNPLTPAVGRDFLIDSPDGVTLNNFEIPEYATYQTFRAEVIHEGIILEQVNYEIHNSPDPEIMKDSNHGSVTLGFIGIPDVMFFNLVVNADWVVENMPVLSHAGDGVAQTVTFNFDLGNPVGMDVIEALVGWSLDIVPGPPPPPSGFIPVGDREVNMWRGIDVDYLSIPPPGYRHGRNPLGIAVANRHQTGLECDPMECVPSAISNSLSWMQDAYGIPAGDKATDIETMKDATGWGPAGCPVDFPAQKDQYMGDNGYGINTNTYPPGTPPNNLDPGNAANSSDLDNAMAALSAGKDVEICGGGHCAAVTGIARNADGSYTITVAHDTDQHNEGGVQIETINYDPNDPNPECDGGWLFDGNSINGFVVESPWP